MTALPQDPIEARTQLSVRDEARLAETAGQLYTAIHAAPDEAPWLRALLGRALDSVDQVRGRDTRTAMARTRGEVPS